MKNNYLAVSGRLMNILGYIAAALSAIAFGLTPLIASHVEANGLSSMEMTFLRGAIAAVVLGVINLIRKESFQLKLKEAIVIAVLSLTGSVLTTIFLMKSYLCIDTSIATTLNFTYPVVVLLIGILVYKEKATKHTFICFGLCMLGILAFCNPIGNFTWKGFFLAFASGIVYGFYVIYMDKSRILASVSMWCFTFWFFAFTAIIMIPVMFVLGDWKTLASLGGLFWSSVYALGDGLLAVIFIQIAVKYIGSRRASLIGAMEPVTSLIIGCLVLGEVLTVRSVIGIALVLAATTYLILLQGNKEKTG